MNQRGQAILLTVGMLGTILALVVVFGNKRQSDLADLTAKIANGQGAIEALNSAARKVQRIYASESGCDPDVLDARLKRLVDLPSDPNDLDINANNTLIYVTAQTKVGLSTAEKQNRCSSGGNNYGCRQIAVPITNKVYVVTVGSVAAETSTAAAGVDCPRDAVIHLSTAVGDNLYHRRVSLTNICTIGSCGANPVSFDDVLNNTPPTGSIRTTACTGPHWAFIRYYGTITNSANEYIDVKDLRWARRYLETGGGATGDTSFAYGNATPSGTLNYTCTPAQSNGQCLLTSCVPVFDLNLDKTNNEADLAILENMLRGYLLYLPVSELR